MSNNVVHFTEVKAGDPEYAQKLREIADEVESGDVTEFVIVGNHRADGNFFRVASFQDRWRLLGALEYAKVAAIDGD